MAQVEKSLVTTGIAVEKIHVGRRLKSKFNSWKDDRKQKQTVKRQRSSIRRSTQKLSPLQQNVTL